MTSLWKLKIFSLALLLICLNETKGQPTKIKIATKATLECSSVLSYSNYSYDAWNAVDGLFDVNVNECGCCFSTSKEKYPYFQASFRESRRYLAIVLEGREDKPNELDSNLTGIHVYLDGIQVDVIFSKTANSAVVFPSTPVQTIRIERPYTSTGIGWHLMICELSVANADTNLISTISHLVETSMSPAYREFNSSLAIDRKVNLDGYTFESCKCCSVAEGAYEDPWWKLDLGKQYLIKVVTVVGRQGEHSSQSQGLLIHITNTTETTNGSLLTDNLLTGGSYLYNFTHPRLFQLLTVTRLKNGILTICEVQLTEGECSVGVFGDLCSRHCYCKDGHPCNAITGQCQTPGCFPGWKGKSCETACSHAHFGEDCVHMCHCYNDIDCDDVTGECKTGRCAPGWTTDSCSEACSHAHFGDDCVRRCHCYNGADCDDVTGECENNRCASGWTTDSCSETCSHAHFGEDCAHLCHCHNGTDCDDVTGECENDHCAPGWTTGSCSKACDIDLFGLDCSSACHCRDNLPCNNVNGTCENGLCEDGWLGSSCSQECDRGTFGINCSSTCHCRGESRCGHVYGACEWGLCDPGYEGPSCNKECDDNKFGLNCSQTCNCLNKTACDNIHGTCIVGKCDTGYQGKTCSAPVPERPREGDSDGDSGGSDAGIGVGLTVLFLVVVGFVVGILYYKRRFPFRNLKYNQEEARPDQTSINLEFSNQGNIHIDDTEDSQLAVNDNRTTESKNDDCEYYNMGPDRRIHLHQLWHYIRRHQANENKMFEVEFKSLPYGLVHPYKDSQKPENRKKNRYRNMYAYDHSRVILQVTQPGETDYINACHINGYECTEKFIASQGPTDDTINDFWRMVWQKKVETIVMVTNLTEAGSTTKVADDNFIECRRLIINISQTLDKVKCVQYWPEMEEEIYGTAHVKLLRTDEYVDYLRRDMTIQMSDGPVREVTQFHFKSWLDKDVPNSTFSLVEFWRATRQNNTEHPIVVHCSAGIGRTGTYIALDILYNQMKAEGGITPLNVVQNLRKQRVNMVQTKDQYAFMHEAVADSLNIGTHFVWSSQFQAVYDYMSGKEQGSSQTRFDDQFDVVVASVKDDSGMANHMAAVYETPSSMISESDAYRPCAKQTRSNDIQENGAMSIPNYSGENVFLITKSPIDRALKEFWSVVQKKNVETVISLGDTSAQNYKGDEESRTVKTFHYTAWQSGQNVPAEVSTLVDLFEAVQMWQPDPSESSPILIYCQVGTEKSGLVGLVLSELQRMGKKGGQINILDSLMQMKERNSGIIQNVVWMNETPNNSGVSMVDTLTKEKHAKATVKDYMEEQDILNR